MNNKYEKFNSEKVEKRRELRREAILKKMYGYEYKSNSNPYDPTNYSYNKDTISYIFTPFDLCDFIIEAVYKYGGLKDNSKILVVENIEFVTRLRTFAEKNGLTLYIYYVSADENKRNFIKNKVVMTARITYIDGSINIGEFEEMKFDTILVNYPYEAPQDADGKRGGGDHLWNKFSIKGLGLLNKNGFLAPIHPAGWRKPQSNRSKCVGLFDKLTKDNQMHYLEMHDTSDGKKTFGAGTRYDWYVVENKEPYKDTVIKDELGNIHKMDLSKYDWLPNSNFDDIKNLLGEGGEVIFSRNNYGSDKKWTSETETEEFCYPLIHSTPKSGVKYYYSNRNDKGHFGVSKVIFGESGIDNPVIDLEGKYGMTQHAMAIPVNSQPEADELVVFLTSKKFKEILKACSWSNFQIDWRLIRDFKKDFWKDFI